MYEEDHIFTYIVTCKHVIEEARKKQPKRAIYMRLNRSDIVAVDYTLVEGEWIYHDDKHVNVAVARHYPKPKPVLMGSIRYPDGVFTAKEERKGKAKIMLGSSVVFVGLFAQYKGRERNYPVVRQGQVVLITDETIEGWYGQSNYHLLECQAYPGNSGSPVFTTVPNENNPKESWWKVWGLIHGFYPHTQRVERDVRNQGSMLWSHFGISMLTPIDYVVDVLNKAVFVEERKKEIESGRGKDRPEPAGLPLSEPEDSEDKGYSSREEFIDVLKNVSQPIARPRGKGKSKTSE